MIGEKRQRELNKIILDVCNALNLDPEKIKQNTGKKNNIEYSDARFIIVEIIRKRYDKDVSYLYIGKLFNRKNHLFAFQAELKCKELKKINKKFRDKYERVIKIVG